MSESTRNNAAADRSRTSDTNQSAPLKSRGYWSETWLRFRRRKIALAGAVYVVLLSVIALLSPMLAGTKPIVCSYKGSLYFPAMGYFRESWENPIFVNDGFYGVYPKALKEKDPQSWAIWPLLYQDPNRRVAANEWEGQPANDVYLAPNRNNWFGTNNTGIDVLAMMIHGTQIALLVGFVSTGVSAAIGIAFGSVAGYLGGWADILLSRVIEVVMCIPTLVLILVLQAMIPKPTIWHTMVILGLTGWTGIARLTRGEFLKLKEMDFVMSARALGAGRLRIMFRHILPNALAPVLVPITFGIASAIILEGALSLLGFGAPPPNPSWGTLLNNGKSNPAMWWLILFPGFAISLTVLAYNLIGEGLQEATDPRLREAGR